MDTTQQILASFAGIVLTGGGAAAFAFYLFRQFGEKWLSSVFERRLEALRHEQAQEIERLRFRIAKMLDRASKLSQREFEVLPDAWAKLVDAYYGARAHVSGLKQIPAVDQMSEEQLEEFLRSSELTETQKNELRNSDNRAGTYHELIYWHEKARIEGVARELSRYLAKFGIFMTTKDRFTEIERMIWDALTENALHVEDKIAGYSARRRLEKEGNDSLKTLEMVVRGELRTLEEPNDGDAN